MMMMIMLTTGSEAGLNMGDQKTSRSWVGAKSKCVCVGVCVLDERAMKGRTGEPGAVR